MKKRFASLVAIIASAVLLFSCGKGAATAPQQPAGGTTGTLRVAVASFGNESFDPTVVAAVWGDALYDPVVTYATDGSFTKRLADSWTMSPDGKEWTFKIHPGIKFHNGDPLTSADFAWNLTRFMDPASTNAWSPGFRANFDRQETPDQYTWKVITKTPEPPLLVSFAALQILPKDYVAKNGIDFFRKNPVGTGPFKFVKFTSGQSLELEAVKDHWRMTPAYSKVIIELVPEEATRVAKLKRNETDIAPVSIDRASELKKDGYTLQSMILPNLPVVAFSGTWMTKSPTSDIRVRQAMSYAINRQELADTLFKGFAKPGGTWFMNESTYGWDPKWTYDPYDIKKAKDLLTQAGYPGKFQDPVIKVYSTVQGTNSWLPDLMQTLAGYWQAAGIQVKIEPVDSAKLNSMIFVRGTEGIVGTAWPWVSTSVPNNIYHSRNMYTSGGVHTTGNDPKSDELFNKMLTEIDSKKAIQAYRDFQDYGRNMYVVIGTVQQFDQMALSSSVGKFTDGLNISLYRALVGIQHK